MQFTPDELRKAADYALDQYGDAKRKDDQQFWLGVYSAFDFLAQGNTLDHSSQKLKPPSSSHSL